MISAQRFRINQEYYDRRANEYPFKYRTAHYEQSKLSPAKFDRAHPKLDFLCIPLLDGQHWCFESAKDLDTFKTWAQTKLIK